jgi:hypothetical protein
MATKTKKAAKSKAASSGMMGIGLENDLHLSRRINFTKAEVRPGILPKTYFLIVSGTKPNLNMDVRLRPLIYIQQPEYWGIEVIGTPSGLGIPVTAPYHVFKSLTGIIGKRGIEVIGANKTKKIKVP